MTRKLPPTRAATLDYIEAYTERWRTSPSFRALTGEPGRSEGIGLGRQVLIYALNDLEGRGLIVRYKDREGYVRYRRTDLAR